MKTTLFNLKTRGKLIVGFGLILTAIVVYISTTNLNISRLNGIAAENRIIQDNLYNISNLKAESIYSRSVALELLYNPNQIENSIQTIEKSHTKIEGLLKQIEGKLLIYPEVKEVFLPIKEEILEYNSLRMEYISLIKNNNQDLALAMLNQKVTPKYIKVERDISTLERSLMDIKSNNITYSISVNKKVKISSWILGALLIFTTLIISIITLRMLRKIAAEMRHGIEIIASSSSDILATVTEISTGAAETASAVSETTATVEEVRQTATLSNNKAKSLLESSNRVSDSSEKGTESLKEVIIGMEKIDLEMKKIMDTVIMLSEENKRIGEITSFVSSIADQSNLLAVNAAIEAAKAGEHGKGFSVVAQEIRNLSDQSKKATMQVNEILNKINVAVEKAVINTKEANQGVERGKELVHQTEEIIDILANNIAESADVSMQISSSNHQQMAGMDQIVPAMENIKKASEQNLKGIQQAQVATKNIHQLGQSLKTILIRYNL